jgi:class 3 adenylate cyclase
MLYADILGMRGQIFNSDYALIQRFIPLAGMIAVAGHPFFYAVLVHVGYRESLPLRALATALFIPMIFFPKDRPLSILHKVYWEAVATLTIPGLFTFFLLMNDLNKYWYSSLVFAGLTFGLFSKLHLIPLLFPLGFLLGVAGFFFTGDFQSDILTPCLLAGLVAFMAAIIAGAMKSSMEYFHKKMLEAKLAEAKAEDLERANHELKRREDLISVFVRPSLVEEIKAGKDPSKFDPVLRNLSILFCDIRDFTTLTEILSPYEKQTFLNQYFTMMTHPIVKNGGEVDKIMGDCVMGLFPDGDSAIRAAVDMRLQLQGFNQKMYTLGQPKIRNGIGIAKGEVMLGNFGSFEKLDRTVIGEAVNIAARLESKTKMYNLEVVVTEDVIRDLNPGSEHYRWIDIVQVKGSSRHLKLYEIYGHQPEEVRRYKDETKDMLEKALTIYFQKGFRDAQRLFRAMLDKVPPHRHFPDDLMDNILRYYLAHCDAWINNPKGSWELIEKWDGVHVFHEK